MGTETKDRSLMDRESAERKNLEGGPGQPCHLVEGVKAGAVSREEFEETLEKTEDILASSHFDISVLKCRRCGRLFLYCFREYTSMIDDHDDFWYFWAPVSEDDVDSLKQADFYMYFLGRLFAARGSVCFDPYGDFGWNSGFNFPYFVFLP